MTNDNEQDQLETRSDEEKSTAKPEKRPKISTMEIVALFCVGLALFATLSS